MTSNGSLARDNTMVACAKEGVAFLEKEGADDLIKLQGLDGVKNGHSKEENGSNGDTNGKHDTTEETAPPTGLPQHRTMVETAKEAEQVLGGEELGETRASTDQLKQAVASSSPPQKSRTMVETAKIGQALLGAEAPLIGETRKQTADTKKAEEESAKETEQNIGNGHSQTHEEEKKEEESVAAAEDHAPVEEEKKSPKRAPPKKSPKASPAAKKQKKEEAEAEAEDAPSKKESSSPRKKGGRPSLVDQLVQEAQKFAGKEAGDVSEGRTTRGRASKGAEPVAASPPKRGRQSKGKDTSKDEDNE